MSEPKANGCICDECAADGLECTNVAPDGEDQCDECALGVHEDQRVEADYAGVEPVE
jgi:hypothetical protein